MKTETKYNLFNRAKLYLMYLITATLILSWLNLNSACIILFAILWIIEGGFSLKLKRLKTDVLFLAYLLYFLVQLASISKAPNFYSGWKYVESQLAFLALPVIFCSSSFITPSFRNKVLMAFSILLTAASLY